MGIVSKHRHYHSIFKCIKKKKHFCFFFFVLKKLQIYPYGGFF